MDFQGEGRRMVTASVRLIEPKPPEKTAGRLIEGEMIKGHIHVTVVVDPLIPDRPIVEPEGREGGWTGLQRLCGRRFGGHWAHR
jgi:hypothetical protein